METIMWRGEQWKLPGSDHQVIQYGIILLSFLIEKGNFDRAAPWVNELVHVYGIDSSLSHQFISIQSLQVHTDDKPVIKVP